MYGVLGEHRSDVETLKVLIRRIADDPSLTIKVKGYNGGAELLRKGAEQIRLFTRLPLSLSRFVVCHDADGPDPASKAAQVSKEICERSGVREACCIVIPVQEIEAWLLADVQAVTNIFKGWVPDPIDAPEAIANPKEHLEALSSAGLPTRRKRYAHATHNERLAKYVDLARVERLCPSARPLFQFVRAS